MRQVSGNRQERTLLKWTPPVPALPRAQRVRTRAWANTALRSARNFRPCRAGGCCHSLACQSTKGRHFVPPGHKTVRIALLARASFDAPSLTCDWRVPSFKQAPGCHVAGTRICRLLVGVTPPNAEMRRRKTADHQTTRAHDRSTASRPTDWSGRRWKAGLGSESWDYLGQTAAVRGRRHRLNAGRRREVSPDSSAPAKHACCGASAAAHRGLDDGAAQAPGGTSPRIWRQPRTTSQTLKAHFSESGRVSAPGGGLLRGSRTNQSPCCHGMPPACGMINLGQATPGLRRAGWHRRRNRQAWCSPRATAERNPPTSRKPPDIPFVPRPTDAEMPQRVLENTARAAGRDENLRRDGHPDYCSSKGDNWGTWAVPWTTTDNPDKLTIGELQLLP